MECEFYKNFRNVGGTGRDRSGFLLWAKARPKTKTISVYSPVALRNGSLFSNILLPFWKQLFFMTGICINIYRQTAPYGRVTQNRFLFRSSEWIMQ